jgi:hypothetical protein
MTIIAYKSTLLADGHRLKGSQKFFEANQPVSSLNDFSRELAPPPRAMAEGVAMSGPSLTVANTTTNSKRATLHLPPRQPRRDPIP